MKYQIEELMKTFSQHAKESEKMRLESIEKFKKEYPNDQLPDFLLNDFNICGALLTIVTEIHRLKNNNS
jgi:hypothetical protein